MNRCHARRRTSLQWRMTSRIIRSHRDLDAWRGGMLLRRQVRWIALQLPSLDLWSVGKQAIDAALSIPANISEGHGRPGRDDYRNFLSMSLGSSAELDTHLIAIYQDHLGLRPRVKEVIGLKDRVARMTRAIYNKV